MLTNKSDIARCICLISLTLIFSATTCYAYTVPDDTIVYVTPSGTKYHRKDCSYTGSVRSMTIAEAERRGYGPCSRCDPDVLTDEYVSTWDGESGGDSGISENSTDSSSESGKSSRQPEEPWYSSPWSALLIVAAVGAFTKVVIILVGAVRRYRYKSRQEYLQNLRQQAKFESERLEYQELYGGKSPEQLVKIPPQYEIGPYGFPREKGVTDGWGRSFTVYLSYSGKCYHRWRDCCNSFYAVNIFDTKRLQGLRQCHLCWPDISPDDYPWCVEYLRIKAIKEKHGID